MATRQRIVPEMQALSIVAGIVRAVVPIVTVHSRTRVGDAFIAHTDLVGGALRLTCSTLALLARAIAVVVIDTFHAYSVDTMFIVFTVITICAWALFTGLGIIATIAT